MIEPAKQKIIIVNEDDEIIGYKERGTSLKEDICRVSALWLTNPNGEILLSKRHHTKFFDPGKWTAAVTGTVEMGETYLDNIIKESEEELGLRNIEPETGPKIRISGDYPFFVQWYTLVMDKKINELALQEDEVEAVAWISPEELKKQVQARPEDFVANMKKYLKLLMLWEWSN